MLALELGALRDLDFNLDLTGFDDDELARFLSDDVMAGLTGEDAVPKFRRHPSQPRVTCGSSVITDF